MRKKKNQKEVSRALWRHKKAMPFGDTEAEGINATGGRRRVCEEEVAV